MIKGHGDDIFQYRNGIRMNFSSNVYGNVSHDGLNAYLCSVISCIRSYPEPEPYSLERLWAEQLDIVDASICVTNGATEAIYLIASTGFQGKPFGNSNAYIQRICRCLQVAFA